MPEGSTPSAKMPTKEVFVAPDEIGGIDMTRLNNGAHFQFIKNVHQKITAETAILANPIAKDAADRLGKALEEEDLCFVLSQKSLLTKRIVAIDRERDEMYMGYRSAVYGFLRSPDKAMAEAAERLWAHLTDYRITTGMQFDRETASIANLVKDCETKYTADVNKLGVKAYIDALKVANEKVDELLLARTTDRSEQIAGALRLARHESDIIYLWLVKIVNALNILHNDTAKCDAFIKFMNEEIKHYKEQSYSSPKKKDPKEPKDPKQPKEPKDPKKPEKPGEGDDIHQPEEPPKKPEDGGGDDIHLPEEPPKKPDGQ